MATISNSYLLRIRAASETLWALENPVLADGEPAYSSDVNQWKIGDGQTVWTELSYVNGPVGPQGPPGPEGPPAPSVNFLGQVATSGSLPGTAELGDAYLVTDPDPDEMWVYGSGGWVYAGVAGVPGPEGPEGPQGPAIQEISVTSIEPTDDEIDIWVHPTENLDGWGLMDARYALKAGDVFDSNVSIVAPANVAEFITDGVSTSTSGLRMKQGGITKWLFATDNIGRLVFARYDDTTGSWIETNLSFSPDTGYINFPNDRIRFNNISSFYGPVITQGGTTLTYTAYTGVYTRIGNLVFCEAACGFTSAGGGSGSIYVSPPVPTERSYSSGVPVGVGTLDVSGADNLPFVFYRQAGAGSDMILQRSDLSNSSWSFAQIQVGDVMRFSMVYHIR